jgi:hypothetical protein
LPILLRLEALALDLSHPAGHDHRVRAGIHRSAILRQPGPAVLDLALRRFDAVVVSVVCASGHGQSFARGVEVRRVEEAAQPLVELGDDGGLADVDVLRVVEAWDGRAVRGELAAVVLASWFMFPCIRWPQRPQCIRPLRT